MPPVSVFMDLEDPINPMADGAASDLANLFYEAGVRGSFCVTGDKCRILLSRGRKDVIEALKPHCLGLHTDTHSKHPTTMELLAGLSWEEGCKAAFATESKGVNAFWDAFGRLPAFWGGAGNTWSPEITDALKRLRIPAYAYALTRLPKEAVHRFNGVLALPQAFHISEIAWGFNGDATKETERVLRSMAKLSRPWVAIFVGHPTRFRHQGFWDGMYMRGRVPSAPEFVAPEADELYDTRKRNLGAFLRKLASAHRIIGVDEAISIPWRFRKPTRGERAFFEVQTTEAIRLVKNWPIHRPELEVEGIVQKTLALRDTLEIIEGIAKSPVSAGGLLNGPSHPFLPIS